MTLPTPENDSWRGVGSNDPTNSRVPVRRVLALLAEAGEAHRRAVLDRFKAAGGDLDRWSRRDLVSMADAITRTEDELELRCSTSPARAKLRTLRRSLEG